MRSAGRPSHRREFVFRNSGRLGSGAWTIRRAFENLLVTVFHLPWLTGILAKNDNPRETAAQRSAQTPVQPFLPFTRPSIDEATIAAVGEVLRSGWLTSNGLKVQAFESHLSAYFGGRPVRTYNSGTCTM